ncbi:hypothetical protein [Nostoc sp. DSM 114159]
MRKKNLVHLADIRVCDRGNISSHILCDRSFDETAIASSTLEKRSLSQID